MTSANYTYYDATNASSTVWTYQSPIYVGSYTGFYGNTKPVSIELPKCVNCDNFTSILYYNINKILYNLGLSKKLCNTCFNLAKVVTDENGVPIGIGIEKKLLLFKDIPDYEEPDMGILVTLKDSVPDELVMDSWKAFNEGL